MTGLDRGNSSSRRQRQSRLWHYQEGHEKCRYPNLEPQGDPLQERYEGDGLSRFGFQNVRGTNMGKGLETAEEMEAMDRIGTEVQGYTETNKPWTPGNRWKYTHMMGLRFKGSRTYFASAASRYDKTYQPGGRYSL